MTGWYCVQTKVSKEVQASVSISGMGFRVYCPVRLVDVCHARKRERVQRPLFPRYLFVSSEHEGLDVGVLNYARGVANKGLFCNDYGKPQVIKDAIIEQIRKREGDEMVRAGEMTSGFKPGDTFLVARGPFTELEAQYVGEDKGKVTAIINMFGRPNMVILGIEALPTTNRAAA